MDQIEVVDEVQSIQNLLSDFLESGNIEVLLLLLLPVELAILVQIVSEQLSDNDEVLLVVKIVDDLEQVLFVEVIAVGRDEAQQFDLVDALVEVVFVVFDDLHAHHLLSVDVVALDCLRERCRAQVLHHLVPSCDYRVHHNRKVFCLFEACFFSVENNSEVVAVVYHAFELGWVEFVFCRRKFDPFGQN